MKKIILGVMLGCMVGMMSHAASCHFALDNRTGVRVAGVLEQIRFSPAWETETAGAVVTVSANGAVVKTATAVGTFDWTPSQSGTYQFSHAVYVNGAQVGETLSATFVVSGMSPISADWSVGSITLKATGVSVEDGELAWLSYCDANAENRSWERVDNFTPTADDVEKSICVTDTGFSSRLGGIPPVKYRLQIGKSKDDARVTLYCTARTKRGIFVGVGEFGADYGENNPKPLPSASEEARKFFNLMQGQGQMKESDGRLLTNSGATYEKVSRAFSDIAAVVKPGDVCVVYFSTHGGVFGNTTIGALCLYDKPPALDDPNRVGYHEALLANHIRMLDPENKGVAVVNIISACHSGAFFDDSNQEICSPASSWCHKENLSTVNVAWFTAADDKTTAYSCFNNFLFDYGWGGGWADADGNGVVSFVELANYTKRQYDRLFSGIVFKGETESKQARIDGTLLGKVFAGSCKVHSKKDSPAAPLNVNADKGASRDNISIRWDGDSNADSYIIFYRFGEQNHERIGIKASGESSLDFTVKEKSQKYDGEYSDFLATEQSDPALFVVKAINGAGISAASEEASGWVDAHLRKVTFNGNGGNVYKSWDDTPLDIEPLTLVWVPQGEELGHVPTVDRTGFTLCGWFNGKEVATSDTVIQNDVTYVAKWTDMTTGYLSSHPKIAAAAGNDIATAANMPAANGCRTVGECYALGIDPEDPNDDFKIEKFEMKDGTPVITLNHTTDGSGNTFESRIKTLGKEKLSDADWVDLTDKDQSAYRFFKVTVDLP